MIYKATGNLRAIHILLGHSKIENTVRCLGVDVEDALLLAERTESDVEAVIRYISDDRFGLCDMLLHRSPVQLERDRRCYCHLGKR